MPLNRDQSHEPTVRSSVPSVTTGRQRTHSIGSDLSIRSRPSTPQNGMNSLSVRRDHANPNIPGGNRKYHLDEGPASVQPAATSLFKIRAPNTMQKHQLGKPQHSVSTKAQPVNPRQENVRVPSTAAKTERAEQPKTSAFDDTGSLNQSMLDDYPDDDQTALVNPQRARGNEQYPTLEANYAREHDPRNSHSSEGFAGTLEPGWEDEVQDERRVQETQGLTSNTGFPRAKGGHIDPHSSNPFIPRAGEAQDPETPTRTHSAPPVKPQIYAPAPRNAAHKTVQFEESNKIYNLSPGFQSSRLDSEDGYEQPISRPNSAQPRVQPYPGFVDQRVSRVQQHLPKQSRQNHSALLSDAGRFHQSGHVQAVRQEDQKVSAPESDNQDYSEDERTQTQQQYMRQEKPPGSEVVDPQLLPSRKRSYDDMSNGLDYSRDQLRQKTLSALQAEAFTRDPRDVLPPPPTDSVGNEMTLAQILENLSKVQEDAQRETFKSLTDEQWARTGQWFVEKFQTDLRRLTEVRLQRRQMAMKYEDAIRRRQRLVEHHEAEVNRELQELQSGGRQLVNGRKVPSGSRSGTPMKSGR